MSKEIDHALKLVREIHDGGGESPFKTELQLRQAMARCKAESIRELMPDEKAKFFDAPEATPTHAAVLRPADHEHWDVRRKGGQAYAWGLALRFGAILWIVQVAGLFGWSINDLGSVNVAGVDGNDPFIDPGAAIEIAHEYSTAVLRIELGDEPVILWSSDPAMQPWFVVPTWMALLDVIGDAAIEAAEFQARLEAA